MSSSRFSRRADADLFEIAEYTITTFGAKQAGRYRAGLKSSLKMLAQNPSLGRRADGFAVQLRGFQYQSHVIFYRQEKEGILIVRVPPSEHGFSAALRRNGERLSFRLGSRSIKQSFWYDTWPYSEYSSVNPKLPA